MVINALYHSLLLFGFSVVSGLDTGHCFWGTTLYFEVLLTVLGKPALISDLWAKYSVVAAIPGSFTFTMVILPPYVGVAISGVQHCTLDSSSCTL